MGFLSTLGKALKSKTVWGAVGLTALNTVPYWAPLVQGTPVGLGLNLALGAFTIYGRIRAKQPLGPIIDDTIAQTVDAVHQLQGDPKPGTATVAAITQTVKAAQ
jgi:hypothetical protein